MSKDTSLKFNRSARRVVIQVVLLSLDLAMYATRSCELMWYTFPHSLRVRGVGKQNLGKLLRQKSNCIEAGEVMPCWSCIILICIHSSFCEQQSFGVRVFVLPLYKWCTCTDGCTVYQGILEHALARSFYTCSNLYIILADHRTIHGIGSIMLLHWCWLVTLSTKKSM